MFEAWDPELWLVAAIPGPSLLSRSLSGSGGTPRPMRLRRRQAAGPMERTPQASDRHGERPRLAVVDPVRHRPRHCWVLGFGDEPLPGVVLRREQRDGVWWGLVLAALPGTEGATVWIPFTHLTRVDTPQARPHRGATP